MFTSVLNAIIRLKIEKKSNAVDIQWEKFLPKIIENFILVSIIILLDSKHAQSSYGNKGLQKCSMNEFR
jgi:uncharacterized membrane protein SirB2